MSGIVMFGDLPNDPANPKGPTIREYNLSQAHTYPLGAYVNVEGGCQPLYVVEHTRDCDGSCLYTLSEFPYPPCRNPEAYNKDQLVLYIKFGHHRWESCIGESSLTPVEVINLEFYQDFLEYFRSLCMTGG